MYILLFFCYYDAHILLNSDNLLFLFVACDPGKLDITVPKLATVYTNHVIISRVYVLLVDVHVGIQAVTVVQVCDTHNLFKYAHTLIFDKQVKYVDR